MGQLVMSDFQTATVSVPRAAVPKVKTRTGVLQCLVVTPGARRADLFQQAAGEQGWETIIAHTADDAARKAVRNRVHLAVIDMQCAASCDKEQFRVLAEELSRDGGPLLVICAAEDDVMAEVWSRQLGVWIHLPGVNEQSDVAMVCGEARNVVQKLHQSITAR